MCNGENPSEVNVLTVLFSSCSKLFDLSIVLCVYVSLLL